MSDYFAEIDIDSSVFNDVYISHLNNRSRIQIYFGGSSSGKSVFLAQRTVIDLMKGGRNYLVCRQVAKTLRSSVFAEIKSVIETWGLLSLFDINKSDMTITCAANGYQIMFVGLDDTEKLKSIRPAKGAWTDIWIEEATETELKSLKQLRKRQRGGNERTKKRVILSFNPIYQTHWIYQEYFVSIGWKDDQKEYSSPQLSILKTTYLDNKFLTSDDRADLENETDKYYYDVYTLGKWGVLGNVIFSNWIVADLLDPGDPYYLPPDQRTNKKFGLDFGFASDPAALHASHYDKKHKYIYVFNELYQTDLSNPELADAIRPITGGELIKADSSEPKSIKELRTCKINAVGAKKGPDSVNFGIQWLKQQTIIFDKRCVNAINEAQTYKWKEDAGGKVVSPPKPVDKNNHWWDSTRYAYEDDMIEVKQTSGKVKIKNYVR